MGLAINNNVASLTAQNNLSKTNSMLGSSLEKLSTGLKVNRGADSPAGLVISEKMRAQISGLKTALDNTNKAVSLVQTGEGALNEMTTLLNKARSLALDSANGGGNEANAYAANQAELTNILGTINKIAGSTEFNGKKLLDGSGAGNSLSTTTAGVNVSGSAAGAIGTAYAVTVTAATKAQATGGGAFAVTANGTFTVGDGTRTASANLTTTDNVNTAVTKINDAFKAAGITNIVAGTATGGALELKATDYTTDITVGGTGTFTNGPASDAHSNASVAYTDSHGVAVTTTGLGNVVTLQGELGGIDLTLDSATPGGSTSVGGVVNFSAGQGFTFQIGANAGQTATVDFAKMTTDSIGTVGANNLSNADVGSAANAQTALGLIDKAISDVSNQRGKLGAFQANTLQSSANNLRTTLENTTAAESVIRDTDFASEIANYTKLQTQMQSGSTVLGNANQMTQLVAQLLRG